MSVNREKLIEDLICCIKPVMKDKKWICIQYGFEYDGFYDEMRDLDVCVYADEISEIEREQIAKVVEKIHVDNELYIDPDILYINKTAFSMSDFNKIENTSPFPIADGRLCLVPVEMTRDFLDSEWMRLRLFLNVFTVKGILLYGDAQIYKKAIDKMYRILINILLNTSKEAISLEDMIEVLYTKDGKNMEYKEYLGYDFNNEVEKEYILTNINRTLSLMVDSNEVEMRDGFYKIIN